jgi:hypothetical protein
MTTGIAIGYDWTYDALDPRSRDIIRDAIINKGLEASLKGGSPSTNHGHMDVGSFVLDMLGERWAIDLDPQSYHSLESKGIDLWNRKQDRRRWTVFRLNNHSQKNLSVNGQLQKLYGKAPIVEIKSKGREPYAVIDMSEVYKGQLESV